MHTQPSIHRPTQPVFALLAVALALLACACEDKVARLELDPPKEMKFYKKGQDAEIRVAAYNERDKPFIRQPKLSWTSSDDTVATVDDKGRVTSTGSGVSKVTVDAEGVSASIDVKVMIVGGIEFAPDMVKDHKASPETRLPIKIIVKDDKGNPMEQHPKVTYDATSGCIDVYQDGTFVPYQKGECSIIAKCAGMEASFRIAVK